MMNNKIVIWAIVMISGFAFIPYAVGDQSSFSEQIEQLKAAKKISVILSQGPDRMLGGVDKDKIINSLQQLDGCHYSVTEPSEVKKLIANFKQLHIKSIPQEKSFLPYSSIAMRFDFPNGKQKNILLGYFYTNELTVDGELYSDNQLPPQTFLIDRMVHRDIRRQLVKHAQINLPTCKNLSSCKFEADFCRQKLAKDFFRSDPSQVCIFGRAIKNGKDVIYTTTDFDRPLPDYCDTGWEPSYNIRQGE